MTDSRPPSSLEPNSTDPLFVGRAAERQRLESLLAGAVASAGGVVLLTGEAGIGKTALVAMFLRWIRQRELPVTLARGRCVEQYAVGEAYMPFLDGLGKLLVGPGHERTSGLLSRYAPTWIPHLPALAGSPEIKAALNELTLGATKERMLREMGDLLEVAAGEVPLVGLLEDLQWADPSTLDLMKHVANRVARQRMLVVVTFRASAIEAASPEHKSCVRDLRVHQRCHEIALGPLGSDEMIEYLDRRFAPNSFPAPLAELLRQKTEGHPLFMAKLLDQLLEQGDVTCLEDGWALARDVTELRVGVPESLRGMIRRRIDALSEPERTALETASVIGRGFSSAILAGALELDELELEEQLDTLARGRLIERLDEEELPDGSPSTRYRFVNTLTQEVLYEELPKRQRSLLHQRIGQVLVSRHIDEAPRIAAQLAMHFEQGRDLTRAIGFLIEAGRNAARLYAHGEASEHLDRALRLAGRLEAGERVEQTTAVHEARGNVNLALSRLDAAADDFRFVLDRARSTGDDRLESRALAELGSALFFSWRVEETAIHANQALQAACRSGDESARIEALALVALVVLEDGGQLAEVKLLLEELIDAARRKERQAALLTALACRGTAHYYQTEYADCEEVLGEALALASEQRDGFKVLLCQHFLGLAQVQMGRISDAFETFERGLEMARRNGDRFWPPRLVNHLGLIHRELQDFEAAIVHDQEGLRLARESGSPGAETGALLNLALDYTQAGRHDDASHALEAIDPGRGDAAFFGWHTRLRLEAARTETWLGLRDLERARGGAQHLLSEATRHGAHAYSINARVLLARVALATGKLDEAFRQLQDAVSRLEEYPAPVMSWRILSLLAEVYSARGDRHAAEQARHTALGTVQRLAASIGDETLKERFMGFPAVLSLSEGAASTGETG